MSSDKADTGAAVPVKAGTEAQGEKGERKPRQPRPRRPRAPRPKPDAKSAKALGMPRKAKNPLHFYSVETKEEVKVELDEKRTSPVMKVVTERFRALSEDDKKKYVDLAVADKERYKTEMAAWRAANPGGVKKAVADAAKAAKPEGKKTSMQLVQTRAAPAGAGPYSQAVVTPAESSLIWVSGQIGLDPKTSALVEGGVLVEAKRALDNIAAILRGAKSSIKNIIKVNVSMTDIAAFGEVNEVYEKFFSGHKPARVCVGVAGLPKGAQIMIDCVAIAKS